MEFIGVFFFPLIGFFMLFFPEDIFEIMNSRRNEANGEPTRSFLIGTRIGGAIMILLGIAGLVVTILDCDPVFRRSFRNTRNFSTKKFGKCLTFAARNGKIDRPVNFRRSLPPRDAAAISPKGGANNMAKISGKYEIVYIIDPAQGEEGIAGSRGKVQGDG